MASATIVVHGDLNDFLPRGGVGSGSTAGRAIVRRFVEHASVKDVLEALGIPHPEIAAIAVGGVPVGFDRRLQDDDRVEVWPAADAVGLAPVVPAAPEDAADPRFVLDAHLGRLAAYLRMLGFDTWYRTDAGDDELAIVAATERRILLTRDRGLLKRSIVRRGACVRSDLPVEQLVEITRRFDLAERWQPFGRCLRCNTPLVAVTREAVLHRLQPLTRVHYDEFRRCPGCDAVYWKGSHHARMERLIDRVRASASGPSRPTGPPVSDGGAT